MPAPGSHIMLSAFNCIEHCQIHRAYQEAGYSANVAVQAHKEDGFRWWVQRLRRMFQLHDEVRIDHFRGFAGKPSPMHCNSSLGPCRQAFCHASLVAVTRSRQGLEACPVLQHHCECCCCRILGSGCKRGDSHERNMEERPRHRALCSAREGARCLLAHPQSSHVHSLYHHS